MKENFFKGLNEALDGFHKSANKLDPFMKGFASEIMDADTSGASRLFATLHREKHDGSTKVVKPDLKAIVEKHVSEYSQG